MVNEKPNVETETNVSKAIKEIVALHKEGIENFIKIKTDFLEGKATKESVDEAKAKLKEINSKIKEIRDGVVNEVKIEDISDEDYALLNGGYNISPDVYNEGIFLEFANKLDELRENGEYEVLRINDLIKSIILKKNMTSEEKKEQISELKIKLAEAKKVAKENEEQVKAISKKACDLAHIYGEVIEKFEKLKKIHAVALAKKIQKERLAKENEEYKALLSQTDKENAKICKMQHESNVSNINRDAFEKISNVRDEAFNAYLRKYNFYRLIRNNRLTIVQKQSYARHNYMHNFTIGGFLLRNALYLVILAFFIVSIILSAAKGNQLLTLDSIVTILSQSSTRIFFSLGVAGLILLGGTDLSIGRMTGMAASLGCLVASQAKWTANFMSFDFTSWGAFASVFVGILVCVFFTTLFSALAGFFTAKFNMHPFITTLSTQLLIFGLMMVCFSQVSAFTMSDSIKSGIVGTKGWQLILFAAIAIAIMWFIWNKTKFGRHMYAVGDNKEAAKVSGINVFSVTMGVFILAGICYGVGGFLEGARIGSANPSLGLGTELDAIAACVIGGISFSGGRGKVGGAVIGTIIFTTLTYCLTFIGFDTNYQYIFKGIIILAAVCLDSLKFIKKA